MKKVIIIGGGFAGLSTAVFLADAGYDIILLEASPKLGGRAYSFYDKELSCTIDNGQHIMMGCYSNTLQFLEIIGAADELEIQERLNVVFVNSQAQQHELALKSDIYPLNLTRALLNFKAIGMKERLKIVDFFLDLAFTEDTDLEDITVFEWLKEKGQSDSSIKSFWEILSIGTLNSRIEEASAATFSRVLKAVFLQGNDALKIILPKRGLSEMYCGCSENFLKQKGAQIKLGEKAAYIEIKYNRAVKLKTNSSVYENFDYIVSAIPLYSFQKLIFENSSIKTPRLELEYSPIISLNIKLKQNPFDKKFYGLIDSSAHWVFNHGNFVTIVSSAAFELLNKTNEEIFDQFIFELENYFPVFSRNFVLSYKVIKEKRATFIPFPGSEKDRWNIDFNCDNLLLAGDWTATKLPATIEGAVKSGFNAFTRITENNVL